MLHLTGDDLPKGDMSLATQLFDPPKPVMALSPAEQRVALKALAGAPDKEIAEALRLSLETVRTHWTSIYARLAQRLPEFAARESDVARRGPERRRHVIEYLRQQPHELRPHL